MGRAIRHRPGASPAGRTTPAQHPPRSSPRPPRPTDPAAGSPILDALAKAGVAFVALKENIRVEGKSNIQTKVMTTLFALFAEVERDLISERTREALPGPGPRAGGSAARKGSLGVFTARRQGGPSALAPVPWSLELRNLRDRRNNSRIRRRNNSRIRRRSLRVRLMNSRRRFEDFGQCVTLPSRWDGRRGRREQPTPPAPSTADTTSTGAIRRAGHDRTARAVVRQSPRYTSAGSARLGPPRSAGPWARRSRPSAVRGSHIRAAGKRAARDGAADAPPLARGRCRRRRMFRPLDAEHAVFDASASDRTGPRRGGQPAQALVQSEPALGEPVVRTGRSRQAVVGI